MPVDHLGAATWCSTALIQSGHNWFAFFSLHEWAGMCRGLGAKDMTDPMRLSTLSWPSKYGDHVQALQSQLYQSRLQMAMMVN